jgi:hypothetical protein
MRPNQHNKRSRGRSRHRGSSGSSGGGGGNPLNRVYESNGPDVKVRGSAQTIAEKYLQLGRDAQASGDNVASENYFQHAEHYLRILAAAQAYNQQMQQQYRRPGDDYDEDDGDEADEGSEAEEAAAVPGQTDQPHVMQDQPASDEARPQVPGHPQRDFRPRDRDRGRPRYDNRRDGQDSPREAQGGQDERAAASEETGGGSSEGGWEAPSFLRKPASNGSQRPRFERRPRREPGNGEDAAPPAEAVVEAAVSETPQGE